MPLYRCYFLDSANHMSAFAVIDSASDDVAQIEAEKLWTIQASAGVELWNCDQMICRQTQSGTEQE
jgi:hypothetical protein